MPITEDQAEQKLQSVAGKINNLPTPPIVFTQIIKVLNNPKSSAQEIGAIIAEDPALTAKVLKLTNSSFFGLSSTITNVKQATLILGLNVIKSLVISSSVFDTFAKNGNLDKEYLEYFWRHSLLTALMAKIIAKYVKRGFLYESEFAFSGGLLHDIGKLIIVSHLQEAYTQIKAISEQDQSLPEIDIETDILEFNHSDLGAYMASRWNLTGEIAFAILYHHSLEALPVDNFAAVVHLADYLAHKSEFPNGEITRKLNPFFTEVWEILELDPSNEDQMVQRLKDDYAKAETFMKMAQGLA